MAKTPLLNVLASQMSFGIACRQARGLKLACKAGRMHALNSDKDIADVSAYLGVSEDSPVIVVAVSPDEILIRCDLGGKEIKFSRWG